MEWIFGVTSADSDQENLPTYLILFTKRKHIFHWFPDRETMTHFKKNFAACWGWSGGAMVLGKLPVPGRPTIWIIVGQGPAALVVGAGWGC